MPRGSMRRSSSAAPLLDGIRRSASTTRRSSSRYTRHIIEQMGGAARRSMPARARSTQEWAACQHFELYDEVPPVLRELAAAGIAASG